MPVAGDKWQWHVELCCKSHALSKDRGEDTGVVLGVVRSVLTDAPISCEGAELVVRDVDAESMAQCHSAQSLTGRQGHTGPICLGGEEAVVEGRVVRDQDAAVKHVEQRRYDVGETGRSGETLFSEAADVHRTRVTTGVDQGNESPPLGPTR